MAEYNFNGSVRKVAYLMDEIPPTRFNSISLLLAYWEVFDGIEIPKDLAKQLMEKATAPETILRSQRKVKQLAKSKKVLECMDIEEDETKEPSNLRHEVGF